MYYTYIETSVDIRYIQHKKIWFNHTKQHAYGSKKQDSIVVYLEKDLIAYKA